MTNKNDVELEKIKASTQKNMAFWAFCSKFIVTIGAVFAIRLIMEGLSQIVLGKPDSITALAKLAEAINMSNITGYFLALGFAVAWKYERNGKKRAISKFSAIKNKYESGESSSGLTHVGDTPSED